MPLPTSGQISMGDINVELGRGRTTANTALAGGSTPTDGSLFGLATSAVNKTAPHRISEFYGYANLTFTQVFGWYTSPCGPQITIYEGSNFLYYSSTAGAGTIFNGTVYIPIGFNEFGSYDWSEQIINNGNFEDNFIIQSGCTPS
jgi:hypothetical protein